LDTLTTATRLLVALSLDEHRTGWRAIEKTTNAESVSLPFSGFTLRLVQDPTFERMTHVFRKPEVLSSTKRCMEDRIMELEVENSRLQRLVVELLLKNQQLRDAHLPSPNHSGKFNQNRSRPRAE
jgi:hypothetical protein